MPVSIRDVASKAGVSVGTVSKALNDAPSRIPAVTREHIRRVADEIGYQPNRLARSLGRRRTDTIGLMISGMQNPFFVDVAEAAERLMLEAQYQVLLDAAPSKRGTYARHAKLRGWPVDGVLMWAEAHDFLSDYLGTAAGEMPVVYLGYPRPAEPRSSAVAFDLYAGGRQLTEHLIARGHGRRGGILYLAPTEYQENVETADARYQAFRAVCAAQNIETRTEVVPDYEQTREAGYLAGQQIAALPPARRPDAVFCHNDVVAVGLYRALRRAGLRVPEDIAVAGFDGIREARYLDDPLTTVEMPADALCRVAVELLLSHLHDCEEDPAPARARAAPQQIMLPTRLIIGGTT